MAAASGMMVREKAISAYQPATEEIFYPSEDGKPVAETGVHYEYSVYFHNALNYLYINDSDVYVAANNLVYYVEGDPKKCFSPDVYVVMGVPKGVRDNYLIWKEKGRVPNVVFEFTSKSTKHKDTVTKRELYRNLGVQEYFLYDPKGEYLNPRLIGLRLVNGRYQRIPLKNGRMFSQQLALELVLDEQGLRLYNPSTKEFLLRYDEVECKRVVAEIEEHIYVSTEQLS